jgi:ribosome biogenesis GTPase
VSGDPVGTVISVFRGGCEVVHDEQVVALRLTGRQARDSLALAVGDELSFDPAREVVLQIAPRRTRLSRWHPRQRREQVVVANIDRLAIVVAVRDPPFRSGAVDRFLLAARAGELEAVLAVNKLDLLEGAALPDEVRAYEEIVELYPVCAKTGEGVGALRARLARSRTVLAGHSGVGKSSLINAMQPELRLETGAISSKYGRGKHTTSSAAWIRLADDAVVVDTPGVRAIATGPVDPELLGEVYPDVLRYAADCRFRDCAHAAEPSCAVRAAIEAGSLRAARLSSYQKLLAELQE